MKYLIFFFILISNSLSFGASSCGGAPNAPHINSNGSPGGAVAKTAIVSKSAFLDASSSVCGNARVNGAAKITNGSEISGSAVIDGSPTISGSKIYGSAIVTGGFRIENSTVCQASKIVENVVKSDYYCQTDDPEPNHPGEAGDKTLMGVDSDADGVRDDVEIWINQNTSNSPNKDMYNQRMALKQIAKNIQRNVLLKDSKESSVELSKKLVDDFLCLNDVAVNSEEYNTFISNIQIESYSTMDRLKAWAKIQGNLRGTSGRVEEKAKKSTCSFNTK